MIDDLATWKSTFAALPLVSDSSWVTNVAQWFADRVEDAGLSGVTDASPPSFSFDQATFESELSSLSPTTDQAAAAAAFSAALESAINGSSLTFAVGTTVGGGGPGGTFSAITSQVIDASSITAMKDSIESDLASAPSVADALDSVLPEAMRTGFLMLTGTLTGLDSGGPPSPLIAANVPFV